MPTKTEIQESPERGIGLLSAEERAVFSQIATKEAPFSQRAQALLAIDEGATQAEAGIRAGLTQGQLRYWLGKFRSDRMAIFPQELLSQAQLDAVEQPPSQAQPIAAPDLGQSQAEDETQPDLLAEETAGPVDAAIAGQEVPPKAKKKAEKKPKKKAKKTKKSAKAKKQKKDKKAKKGNKPKKNKSKKAAAAKSGSAKKKRKK